jgi:phosphoenolpyruvate-protein kinase (PTS system EI component)
VTLDGIEIELLANIGTPAEAHRAIELGAHGVGLFRTEFLFLERRAAPTEDEQVAAYRSVADAFAPWPVTIRLLDAGGDKAIPYFGLPHEANPFLGVRGIRLADVEPNIFVSQLRAAMRAAATDGETHEATAGDHERGPSASPPVPAIKLMAPMVADESDVATLHQLVTRAAESLAAEGIAYGPISVGAMVEVPSAVVLADRLFPALDFVSLGTNDLLQYVLAADRGHAALSHYHDPFHPALLRLVRSGVTEARRVGIELSVCGEMAADPLAALALVGLGVRTLSMAAGSLATVRRHIRARTLFELTTAVVAACDAATGAEARAYLNELVAGRRLLSDDRPEEAHHDEEAREQGDQPEPAIG